MKTLVFVTLFALIFTLCASTAEINDANFVEQQKDSEFNGEFENQEMNNEIINEGQEEEGTQFKGQQEEEQPENDENDFVEEEMDATKTISLKKNQVIKAQGLGISVGHNGQIIITLNNKYRNYWTTYTVWGKTGCRRGATTLYSGYIGGSDYNHRGDSSEYICLPKNPQYLSTVTPRFQAYLHGTEYESWNRVFAGTTHDYNAPCAVCKVRKQSTLMIPARYTCPQGWTREYYGYLMTSYYNHPGSKDYKCVHVTPDLIPGSQANTNGALLYFVQLRSCAVGLPCGTNQYALNRATTCVVCSKN